MYSSYTREIYDRFFLKKKKGKNYFRDLVDNYDNNKYGYEIGFLIRHSFYDYRTLLLL